MTAPKILCGDCLKIMQTLEPDIVDAIVTDPPYGLAFMGKEWDHGVPGIPFWKAAFRVAKPGAYLLAFGGTRTFHRLTCAIEDAGWEIRDCLMWVYGTGFPKSRNIGKDFDKGLRTVIGTQSAPGHAKANVKQGAQTRTHLKFPKYSTTPVTALGSQWDGWGTGLKPAWEPVILARKPLVGTVAANVAAHGTGALNIDGCRIAGEATTTHSRGKTTAFAKRPGEKSCEDGGRMVPQNRAEFVGVEHLGRWPANLVLDEDAAAMLDEQSGERNLGRVDWVRSRRDFKGWKSVGELKDLERPATADDSGGASRFFYCAKASRAEREAGLEGQVNMHPTVKPVALMRWLIRLVTPPDALVLDPFMGSGTTGIACIQEGRSFIGIDREKSYVKIARKRIAKTQTDTTTAAVTIKKSKIFFEY